MTCRIKRIISCSALFLIAMGVWAAKSHAYRLPAYRISSEEKAHTVAENRSICLERLEEIGAVVPLSVAGTRRQDYRRRLSASQRRAAADYEESKIACDFWGHAADLKASLLSLHERKSPAKAAEADDMAKAVVQKIYDLSQEYRVFVSAWLHNAMVNKGRREKGHCYHYVSDIRGELATRAWMHFDMHWGEAWPDTFRENNALIITAKGMSFRSGLAIDPWRTAGKPFWTPVEGDRFPWQDAGWVEIAD